MAGIRLKLEVIKYSMHWGLLEGDITQDRLEKIMR